MNEPGGSLEDMRGGEHDHPEIENRISGEINLVRTDIGDLGERLDDRLDQLDERADQLGAAIAGQSQTLGEILGLLGGNE